MDASSKRMNVVVTHPWLGKGGSEAVAAWTLHGLQHVADVTFVSSGPFVPELLNAVYGTKIEGSKIRFVRGPHLPGVRDEKTLVAMQTALFHRFCHSLGVIGDVGVSTYNFTPLAFRTIHLIADFSWDDEALSVLNPNAAKHLKYRGSILRRSYHAVNRLVRGRNILTLGKSDSVFSNSQWTSNHLLDRFRIRSSGIIYPPVQVGYVSTDPSTRDPFQFVCLGRVSPEKKIENVISILERVRRVFPKVRLVIAGGMGRDAYSQKIRGLVQSNSDWIEAPGFLNGSEKEALFAESTYGIHGCEGEAFGIAVAEQIVAGCIPIVPAKGGTGELVPVLACKYNDEDQAVIRILDLLNSAPLRLECHRQLTERAAAFGPEGFVDRIREIVIDPPQPAINWNAEAFPLSKNA